jgi:hypothetical protein
VCGQLLKIATSSIGVQVRCPRCKAVFTANAVPPVGAADTRKAEKALPPVASRAPVPVAAREVPAPGPEDLDFLEYLPTSPGPAAGRRRRRLPGPLAAVSPAFLLLTLILFACPWVEVRCEGGAGARTLVSQSGYQVATGDMSTDPGLLAAARAEEKDPRKREEIKEPSTDWAPLLLFALAMFAAGLFGALPALFRGRRWRDRLGVAGAAVVGALCLIVQAASGFPVENRFKDRMESARPSDKDQAAALAALSVRRTPWFWLALVSATCAAGAPFVEMLAGPRWEEGG